MMTLWDGTVDFQVVRSGLLEALEALWKAIVQWKGEERPLEVFP